MIAVREYLVLAGQIRASAVDEVDARQSVCLGDFLGAKMLLDRHWMVDAALHGCIVGEHHHVPTGDQADAGNCPRRRHLALVHAMRREQPYLQKRRFRIEQPLHPVPGQHLAACEMAGAGPLPAAREGYLRRRLELGQTDLHLRPVCGEVIRSRVDAALDLHGGNVANPTDCSAAPR